MDSSDIVKALTALIGLQAGLSLLQSLQVQKVVREVRYIGDPTSEVDYIVFYKGGEVKAKDCETGNIVYTAPEGGEILYKLFDEGNVTVQVKGEIPIDATKMRVQTTDVDWAIFVLRDNSALIGTKNAKLKFYGSGDAIDVNTGQRVEVAHGFEYRGDNIKVENITIDLSEENIVTNRNTNLHTAFRPAEGFLHIVNNVKVTGFVRFGIGVGVPNFLIIANSLIKSDRGTNDVIGSWGTYAENIFIINNYIGYPAGNTGDIDTFYNASIDLLAGKNVIIAYNTLEGRIALGSEFGNHENWKIIGNTINTEQKNWRAILLEGKYGDTQFTFKNVEIKDNTIYGHILRPEQTVDTTTFESYGLTIKDNTIIPLTNNQIVQVYDTDDVIIKDNIIKGYSGTLDKVFDIVRCSGVLVDDNRVNVPYNTYMSIVNSTLLKNSGIVEITGDGSTTEFTVEIQHNLISDKAWVSVSTAKATTAPPNYIFAYLTDKDGDGFRETLVITVRFDAAPAGGEVVELYWKAGVINT